MLLLLATLAAAEPPDIWVVESASAPNGRSARTVQVSRPATSEVAGWPEGTTARPKLEFRCERRRLTIRIDTGLPVEVYGDHFDEYLAPVVLRFDDRQEQVRMRRGMDPDALFFKRPKKAIEELLGVETLGFTFSPSNSPPATTTFDLSELAEALEPMREQCRIP